MTWTPSTHVVARRRRPHLDFAAVRFLGSTTEIMHLQRFTQVLDISDTINESNDRGLISLVAHPSFPTQPYYYMVVRSSVPF
jgi:hypothetical protein